MEPADTTVESASKAGAGESSPPTAGSDLVAFRDAVAADVAAQYPRVDYVAGVVAAAIERHAPKLGWNWYVDGPRPNIPLSVKTHIGSKDSNCKPEQEGGK